MFLTKKEGPNQEKAPISGNHFSNGSEGPTATEIMGPQGAQSHFGREFKGSMLVEDLV